MRPIYAQRASNTLRTWCQPAVASTKVGRTTTHWPKLQIFNAPVVRPPCVVCVWPGLKGTVTQEGRMGDAQPALWKSENVLSPTFVRMLEKLASWHRMILQGVCPTYVWRWSSALHACLAFFLACTFMRRAPRTLLSMLKKSDAHSEWRRMHSVGPSHSTNG